MSWINPNEILSKEMESLHFVGEFEKNPFYERWKRGRPSKEAKEKRAKSWEWEREMDIKYPNRKPFLAMLMSTPHSIVKAEGGKVRIQYVQRNTGNE